MSVRSCALIAIGMLLSSVVSADDRQPLIAPADAPRYQISIKEQTDVGVFMKLTISYRRTREGKLIATLAGRNSKGGDLFGLGGALGAMFPNPVEGEFEVTTHGFRQAKDFVLFMGADSGMSQPYLVSNVLRIGNPEFRVAARAPTEQDKQLQKQLQELNLRRITPPGVTPEGYIPVTADMELLSGMPIKAGRMAKWVDAEVLAAAPSRKVTVRFPGGSFPEIDFLERHKWLAIDPDVLAKAKSDPDSFQPSMRVLPGSRVELPDDAVPIPNGLEVPRGTRIFVPVAGQYDEALVDSDRGSQIDYRLRHSDSRFKRSKPQDQLAIASNVLEDIIAAEKAAAEREANRPEYGGRESKAFRRFPIRRQVPDSCVVAPPNLDYAKGMLLLLWNGDRWTPVEVVETNDDDTLRIAFAKLDQDDVDVLKTDLIIRRSVAEKLERKQRKR